MRPFYAMAAAAAILGSAAVCVRLKVEPPPVRQVVRKAEGRFSLEVTLTFDAAPDEFAIEPLPALLMTFQGKEVIRRMQPIKAGEPIRVEDIPGVEQEIPGETQGRNEFFVEAFGALHSQGGGFSINDETTSLPHRALRVRLYRDSELVAEKTLWSAPGEPVKGIIELVVPAAPAQEHDHEHA